MAFDQKRYTKDYNKRNYQMFQFRVNKEKKELIGRLSSLPNRTEFILRAIENEFRKKIYTLDELKQIIVPILRKHGVKEAFLFGSYVKGTMTGDSDIDLYCSDPEPKTNHEFFSMCQDLEDALAKEIDITLYSDELDPIFKWELDRTKVRIL